MKSKSKSPSQALKPRHMPQRSCIVCRDKRSKKELIRLVVNIENIIEIDPRGKKSGRGAYLCPKLECWDTGINKGRLEYALRTRLSPENRQALLDFARSLSKKEA